MYTYVCRGRTCTPAPKGLPAAGYTIWGTLKGYTPGYDPFGCTGVYVPVWVQGGRVPLLGVLYTLGP
jgi:hypothetical protein